MERATRNNRVLCSRISASNASGSRPATRSISGRTSCETRFGGLGVAIVSSFIPFDAEWRPDVPAGIHRPFTWTGRKSRVRFKLIQTDALYDRTLSFKNAGHAA